MAPPSLAIERAPILKKRGPLSFPRHLSDVMIRDHDGLHCLLGPSRAMQYHYPLWARPTAYGPRFFRHTPLVPQMMVYSLKPRPAALLAPSQAWKAPRDMEALAGTRPKIASQRGPACCQPVWSRHGRHRTGSSVNLPPSLFLSPLRHQPRPPGTGSTRVSVLIMQFPGTSSDHGKCFPLCPSLSIPHFLEL